MSKPDDSAAPQDPERFWAEVLSAESERIRRAFHRLSTDEAAPVLAHLRRMATEMGWQTEQRRRARVALEAIDTRPSSDRPEA